jgi:hypothetical protein
MFSLGLAATTALGVLAATATVQPVRADKPKEIVVVGTPKKAGHFSGVRNRVGQGRSQPLNAKRKGSKSHVKVFSQSGPLAGRSRGVKLRQRP